jgi:pimeloyl-ACP methyl ester carboxylesterase
MSMPGRMHEIRGVHYHVFDEGDSDRAVLLLHGMPDTSRVWRHQVSALRGAGYRVIAPDMLGYGETDKPADPARYAGEEVVADVLALVEKLGVENIDVVGHDWGAFLSWELVSRFPSLFRRHIAISVGHVGVFVSDFSAQSLKQNWYMYLNTQEDAVDLYRFRDCEFFVKNIVPSHPEPGDLRTRLRYEDAMRGCLNWDRGNPLASFFLAHQKGELRYEKCTVPTLGIWSSGDDYLLEEHMQRTQDFMAAEWRYERIEGGSHWAMLDRPDEVSALMLDWLDAKKTK